jgi:hypothetical protein
LKLSNHFSFGVGICSQQQKAPNCFRSGWRKLRSNELQKLQKDWVFCKSKRDCCMENRVG